MLSRHRQARGFHESLRVGRTYLLNEHGARLDEIQAEGSVCGNPHFFKNTIRNPVLPSSRQSRPPRALGMRPTLVHAVMSTSFMLMRVPQLAHVGAHTQRSTRANGDAASARVA